MPDEYGQMTPDELLQAAMGAGLYPQRMQQLQQRMGMGNSLMDTPSAQGRNVGQTYVAASPLEHVSNAIRRLIGAKMAGDSMQGQQDLTTQLGKQRQQYMQGLGTAMNGGTGGTLGQEGGGMARPADPAQGNQMLMGAFASGDPGLEKMASGVLSERNQERQMHVLENTMRHQQTMEDLERQKVGQGNFEPVKDMYGNPTAVIDKRSGNVKPLANGGGGGAQADVKQLADSIQNGDLPPDMSNVSRKVATQAQAELGRRGFNLTHAQQEYSATKHFVATLNGTQQVQMRQSLDAVSHQLDQVEGLYKNWQEAGTASGIKVFNRAALAMSKQLGGDAGTAAQNLETALVDLTSEFGQVYGKGGAPTDHALHLAEQNLKAEWNPQTFMSSLNLARNGIRMRVNALSGVTPVGTGGGPNPYYQPPPSQPTQQTAAPQLSPRDTQAVQMARERLKTNPQDATALQVLKMNGVQ